MPGRYDKSSDFSFDVAGGLKPKKRPDIKADPLEEMLRLAGGVAPMAGAAIGGAVGGPVGMGIGAGIGSGVGALANYGADKAGEDEAAERERRRREDEEQAAQNQAALSLIGALG